MKNMIDSSLVGVNGNAFALLAHFKREARKAGWNKSEIDEVVDDAMSGDYNHLVAVLAEWFIH